MVNQTYCPECGGILFYDPPVKAYGCKSCGIFITKDKLNDIKRKLKEGNNSEADYDAKRRNQDDYLKWWLSGKKT
tara:strand:+ start:581 stop:805 length:225 start_codon:yes stop_codon:yes gene_type:complete